MSWNKNELDGDGVDDGGGDDGDGDYDKGVVES